MVASRGYLFEVRVFTWFLAITVALAAAALGARAYAGRAMSSRAVTPKAMGSAVPDSSLHFSRVAIPSGDRTLIGWWVRASRDSTKPAPSVLFLHGNRSAISDYVGLLRFFHREGINTLVFDYSGFGASGGSPSLKNAIADAGVMARVFADSAGKNSRKVAMGSALGATVLLQAIDSVQPHVNGLVIEGVDASVREAAVRSGRLPKLLAPLVAELGDNVAAASRVDVPLLAVHSFDDPRAPIADAERVIAAVPGRASLVRHWRKGHSAILTSTRTCDWAPVLSFVTTGTLPPKLDTTDVCKAEAARRTADSAGLAAAAAAEQRKRDSIAALRASRTNAKAPPAKVGTTKAGTTKAAPTRTPATKAPVAKAPQTKTGGGTKSKSPPPVSKKPAD
jgi:uncharacterized protein